MLARRMSYFEKRQAESHQPDSLAVLGNDEKRTKGL